MQLLRVLLVENSDADTELVLYELEQAGYRIWHRRVETMLEMKRALRCYQWDIILPGFYSQ